MHTTAVRGEVALWRAVIDQAMTDATLGLLKGKPGRRTAFRPSAERMLHKDRARAWLLDMGHEFQEVCDMAQLDAEAVQAAARRQIDQADFLWAFAARSRGAVPSRKRAAAAEIALAA